MRAAARRPARGRFFPCALALRAAEETLVRASDMARFSGSDMYLRGASTLRRRLPAARHASEHYLTDRVAVGNPLPHSLHSARCAPATSLSALAVQRLQ